MRKIRNILIGILSICLLLSICEREAFAASGSVTLSSASGKVGSTVTVNGTVRCSDGAIGAATVTLSYDPTGLKFVSGSGGTNGGSGSVKFAGYGDGSAKALNFSLKFKILKEGSFRISGSADGYNFDEQQLSMKVSGSSVTGKVQESNDVPSTNPSDSTTKSSNAKLSSLKVYPGTLSPSFSADTKSYTVSVPEGTTEVTISASLQDDGAKFYTTGGKDLKEDVENVAKVVVTAEDGTTSSYSLKILIEKKERITIDGTEYTVESIAKKEIPKGFEKTTVSYAGKQLVGLQSTTYNLTALALAEDGEKGLYMVDVEGKSLYPLQLVKISKERTICLLPITEKSNAPENMEQATVNINKKRMDAWKEADGLFVLPVIDQQGKELRYRYDERDKTYQRYVVTEKDEMEEQEEEVVAEPKETLLPPILEEYYDYILIGALGVIVILLILVIAFGANTDKRRRKKLAKLKAMKQKESNPWIDL